MTNREAQEAYRNRMYAAGLKQVRLWVSRDFDIKASKLRRKAFMLELDRLTLGMSKPSAEKLYARLLRAATESIKEVQEKKK
jgi:hypothetical protein